MADNPKLLADSLPSEPEKPNAEEFVKNYDNAKKLNGGKGFTDKEIATGKAEGGNSQLGLNGFKESLQPKPWKFDQKKYPNVKTTPYGYIYNYGGSSITDIAANDKAMGSKKPGKGFSYTVGGDEIMAETFDDAIAAIDKRNAAKAPNQSGYKSVVWTDSAGKIHGVEPLVQGKNYKDHPNFSKGLLFGISAAAPEEYDENFNLREKPSIQGNWVFDPAKNDWYDSDKAMYYNEIVRNSGGEQKSQIPNATGNVEEDAANVMDTNDLQELSNEIKPQSQGTDQTQLIADINDAMKEVSRGGDGEVDLGNGLSLWIEKAPQVYGDDRDYNYSFHVLDNNKNAEIEEFGIYGDTFDQNEFHKQLDYYLGNNSQYNIQQLFYEYVKNPAVADSWDPDTKGKVMEYGRSLDRENREFFKNREREREMRAKAQPQFSQDGKAVTYNGVTLKVGDQIDKGLFITGFNPETNSVFIDEDPNIDGGADYSVEDVFSMLGDVDRFMRKWSSPDKIKSLEREQMPDKEELDLINREQAERNAKAKSLESRINQVNNLIAQDKKEEVKKLFDSDNELFIAWFDRYKKNKL